MAVKSVVDDISCSSPNLAAVVDHYDTCFQLGLSAQQKSDLVELLKSR